MVIAETDSQYTSVVTEGIHSGFLEVIAPSPHFYPGLFQL